MVAARQRQGKGDGHRLCGNIYNNQTDHTEGGVVGDNYDDDDNNGHIVNDDNDDDGGCGGQDGHHQKRTGRGHDNRTNTAIK